MDKFNDERSGSWRVYEKYVLAELARNGQDVDAIRKQLDDIKSDLIEIKTAIKIKQAIFGFVAGALGAVLTGIIEWLKTK